MHESHAPTQKHTNEREQTAEAARLAAAPGDRLVLIVRTENAAFRPNAGPELARILRELSLYLKHTTLAHQTIDRPILDDNGQWAGRLVYVPPQD